MPDAIKQEKDARRHVIAAEVNTFFKNLVPPGVRLEDLWAVSRFHLISPTRGFVQFPQSEGVIASPYIGNCADDFCEGEGRN